MPQPATTDQHEDITAVITALGTVLARRCLNQSVEGDAESARRLSRRLVEINAPAEILAVATGGVWAGFRPAGELEESALAEIAEVARAFLEVGGYDGLVALASAALALMAARDMTSRPGSDLVLAAQTAWEIEHHPVAFWAADLALRTLPLNPLDHAIALMLKARITNDPEDIELLTRASAGWTDEVRAKVDVASLVPGPKDVKTGNWAAARDAVMAGDRITAARLLADELREMSKRRRDEDFLNGAENAFRAMAQEQVDVVLLRKGLVQVVKHLRTRQRFGLLPPAARATLELVVFVLLSATDESVGSVLVELLEALADAGLSEITLEGLPDVPAAAEAQLVERARAFPLWPDLQACVDGLDGQYAVLLRHAGGAGGGAERWISVFVVPPDGVLIKNATLTRPHQDILHALESGSPDRIASIASAELSSIAVRLLHADALSRIQDSPGRGLVVVPDGLLWNLPWHVVPEFARLDVAIAPSLAVYGNLPSVPRHVRRISALIDDSVDGSDLVLDRLLAARASGRLDVDLSVAGVQRECDLLIVLAHGSGSGLGFATGLGHTPVSALELATGSRARSSVLASCWSAKRPPVAMPINLPIAMLLGGAACSAGGIWPLPERATAELVATALDRIIAGEDVATAVSTARRGLRVDRMAQWGLVVNGRLPDPGARVVISNPEAKG
jgi:hypothetical protein